MHVTPTAPVAGSRRRTIIIAVALACTFAAFVSQTLTAATRTITFEEAVDIALQRNLGLLLAGNVRGLDDASVSDALWRFLPDLRMSVSGNRSFDKTQTGTGGASWTTGKSLSAGISSGVTLFDGFNNVSSLREARFEQAAGNLDYARARQTVVFQVITDYLALIEATEQKRVRQENLTAQEEQIKKVRALVEEGERPTNELYQQEANVAEAKLALVEARRTLKLSRVDLMQTLHLNPLEEIDFVIPPAEALNPGDASETFATLLETAIHARTDLAAELERFSASGERLTQAKSGWWPTLSLSGSFTTRYSDAVDGDFFAQLDDRQSAGLGFSLSLPLFDRMQTRNAVRRAEINVENAEIALDQLRQDVALQVWRAVLDRDAARESLSAAKTRVAAARESLLYTNERYLAGASTLFEVTLARAALVAAESGEVNARYQLLWQSYLVEYYVGTLQPEDGLGR